MYSQLPFELFQSALDPKSVHDVSNITVEQWRDLIARVLSENSPIHDTMGAVITEKTLRDFVAGNIKVGVPVVLELTVDERHLSVTRAAHGGVLAILSDAAMGLAGLAFTQPLQMCSTVEFKINYVKPVVKGNLVRAEAKVLHFGNTHAVIFCETRVGDTLVATAVGTFNYYQRLGPKQMIAKL